MIKYLIVLVFLLNVSALSISSDQALMISQNISTELVNVMPGFKSLGLRLQVEKKVFEILGKSRTDIALFRNLGKLFPPDNHEYVNLLKRGIKDTVMEVIYYCALILGIIHLSLVATDLIRGRGFTGLRDRMRP